MRLSVSVFRGGLGSSGRLLLRSGERRMSSSRGLMSMASSGIGAGLAVSAGVIAASNFAGFAITAKTRTHKVADLLSSGPFLLSALATFAAGPQTAAGLAVTAVTSVWSIRLTSFLFRRVLKVGNDARFDEFIPEEGAPLTKSAVGNLAAMWTVMATWGFVVSLPVTIINSSAAVATGPVFWVMLSAQSAAFLFEWVADIQKSNFKNIEDNKGKFITTGLWKYSRHPNYFGEMAYWWSCFGATLAAGGISAPYLLSMSSPVFTTWILLKASGIPMAEKNAEEKYGDREDYKQYTERTNMVVPWFPKKV